ncbi:Clock-controlled protein 6 [Teratosphaeria destructans]|uniref:Clock-controlled protein 6 n=1 Tax=Teratosphaeria destructans TaxID=418781 RepID=A0A9W7SS30_9PEZI|nr:Clock-controlled protein 6 [Teratosphaeria destructans]
MQYIAAAALFGAVAAAHAYNGTASDVYVTEVVTAFTTYCPYATEVPVGGGSTITVSEATTLVVTSCSGGCTLTHPVSSAAASTAEVTPVSTAPVGPVVPPASSGLVTSPVPATPPSTTTSAVYTGAAPKVQAVGAGFLALVGLVAAL